MNRRAKAKREKNAFRNKVIIFVLAGIFAAASVFLLAHGMFTSHAADNEPSQTNASAGEDNSGKITRGVVNDLNQFNKDMTYDSSTRTWKRNADYQSTIGTSSNPFLVLEVVPNNAFAYFGYMVDGCQPLNIAQLFNYLGGNSYGISMGALATNCASEYYEVTKVFADEHEYERANYDGKQSGEVNQQYYTKYWKHVTDKSLTMSGYYEYVGSGKGSFNYTGNNIAVGERYAPEFEKVGYGNGDFIWVTIEEGNSLTQSVRNYIETNDNYNKTVKNKDDKFTFELGDRQYTTRTDNDYYEATANTKKYSWRADNVKLICQNNFLSQTLQIPGKEAQENYKIVYKVIEPWELNANPEWVDKCDFIYMHTADETGGNSDGSKYKLQNYEAYKKLVNEKYYDDENIPADDERRKWTFKSYDSSDPENSTIRIDTSKNHTDFEGNFGIRSNGGAHADELINGQNDITFDVARRMFEKCNGLGEYDGNFAPVMMSYYCARPDNTDTKSVKINKIEYSTLDQSTEPGYNNLDQNITGSSNNVFKFSIMQCLMEQKNFHKFFFEDKRQSTGTPVIAESADGKNGYITSFHNNTSDDPSSASYNPTDAEKYWYYDSFMPAVYSYNQNNQYGGTDFTGVESDRIEQYKIYWNKPGGPYKITQNEGAALYGPAFVYNSNNVTTTKFSTTYGDFNANNTGSQELIDWYNSKNEKDSTASGSNYNLHYIYEPKSMANETAGVRNLIDDSDVKDSDEYKKLGTRATISRIIEYLLKYKRGAGSSEIDPDGKTTFNILEIEPCNDFDLNETTLSSYLPASKYGGKFKFTYMTTEEFNGSKKSLGSEYDMIYIGDNRGKYNTETDNKVKYQDGSSWVERSVTKVQYNDKNITKQQKGGNPYKGYAYIHTGDEYATTDGKHLRTSGNDITSGKRKDLRNYVTAGKLVFVSSNLYRVYVTNKSNNATKDILNTVDPASQMYSLLQSTSGRVHRLGEFFSPSVLKTFQNEMSSTAEISSYPTEYHASTATDSSVYALNSSTLSFSFTAGNTKDARYRVKLYVDTNNDGFISDDSNGDELVYDSKKDDAGFVNGLLVQNGIKDSLGHIYFRPASSGSVTFDLSTVKEKLSLGSIAWRFVVYNNNLEGDQKVRDGVSYIDKRTYALINGVDSSTVNKGTISVLQVVSDSDYGTKTNLQQILSDKDSKDDFYRFTNGSAKFSDDFEMRVHTVKLSDFKDALNNPDNKGTFTYDEKTYRYPDTEGENDYNIWDKDGTHTYNVLLISCGSALASEENADAAKAYVKYAAGKGASVVYSGDAFTGAGNGEKKLLGADRSEASEANAPFALDESRDVRTGAGDSYYTALDYTYAKAITLENASGDANKYKNYKNLTGAGKNKDGWDVSFGNGKKDSTDQITRLNAGKVTTFPYSISGHISTNSNAAQDYQLYLENGDITVWYCLAGDYYDDSKFTGTAANATNDNRQDSTMYDVFFGDSKKWTHSTYGVSPNDAVNNYYLYSYQNIIYDAADLKKFSSDSASSRNDEEMKLFINTLVNAFQTNFETPYVELVNSENISNGKSTVPSLLTEDDFDIKEPKYSFDKTPDSQYEYNLSLPTIKNTKKKFHYKEYTDSSTVDVEGDDPVTEKEEEAVTPGPTAKVVDDDVVNTPEPTATPMPTPDPPETVWESSDGSAGQGGEIRVDLSKFIDKPVGGYYLFEFRHNPDQLQYNHVSSLKEAVAIRDGDNWDHFCYYLSYDEGKYSKDAVHYQFFESSKLNAAKALRLMCDYRMKVIRVLYCPSYESVKSVLASAEAGSGSSGSSDSGNSGSSSTGENSGSGGSSSGSGTSGGSSSGDNETDKVKRTNVTPLFNGKVTKDGETTGIIDDLLYNGKDSIYSTLEGIQKAGVDTADKVTNEMFTGINNGGYTNRIYFRPVDNYMSDRAITGLKVSLTSINKDGVEAVLTDSKPVDNIFYSEVNSAGDGYNTYRYDADASGLYTTESGNYLKSGKIYFMLYNKDSGYNALKFEIWNKNGYSVTYMRVYETEKPAEKSEDVYLFNLD